MFSAAMLSGILAAINVVQWAWVHDTVSVGRPRIPKLLVEGTEMGQLPSPVQSAQWTPALWGRTGWLNHLFNDSYTEGS